MITWMQKHKKWLVITIWISTIAFVGAGFVGWGSYDYGKSNSAVAIVGETEVPLNDLQNEYSALYSQYSQMFGESFNKELADQLKLEDAALQKVIQKYLLINYANDLGLDVTDQEVAKQLVQIKAFLKNGKFDKNTYLSVLKQNRRTASEFEEQLKKDLLVSKVQKIYNTPLLKNEIKNFGELLYLEDKISINVVKDKNIKVAINDKVLKGYWEKNKNNYKTPEGFKVEYSKIDNIKNKTKKDMKKIALKEYLHLKKGKTTFKTQDTIYANSNFLNPDDFIKLTKSKSNDTLKPFYANDSYYVFKLVSKIEPQVKSYSEVSNQVKSDYISQEKAKVLKVNAQKIIENFKGTSIGFISRDSKATFDQLSSQESAKLVSEIFNSTTKISSVQFEDKIVVFRIEDSKLGVYDEKYEKSVKAIVENIKNNEITQNLMAKLQNSYEVKSFLGKK